MIVFMVHQKLKSAGVLLINMHVAEVLIDGKWYLSFSVVSLDGMRLEHLKTGTKSAVKRPWYQGFQRFKNLTQRRAIFEIRYFC